MKIYCSNDLEDLEIRLEEIENIVDDDVVLKSLQKLKKDYSTYQGYDKIKDKWRSLSTNWYERNKVGIEEENQKAYKKAIQPLYDFMNSKSKDINDIFPLIADYEYSEGITSTKSSNKSRLFDIGVFDEFIAFYPETKNNKKIVKHLKDPIINQIDNRMAGLIIKRNLPETTKPDSIATYGSYTTSAPSREKHYKDFGVSNDEEFLEELDRREKELIYKKNNLGKFYKTFR